VLAVAALTVAGAVTVVARTTPAQAATLVEDEGADCAVSLPGSLTANSKLPDPFKKLSGTRITARSEWRCRREEIKKLSEKYVYGEKPGKPESVTGTVTSSSITVNVTDQGKSASFSASVSLPSGSGPFPAVVVLGGFGADTTTIKAAGAAVINYDPLAVGKEGTARNNKQGAFYSIYGATSTTGLLMAWAWGVSRIIDVMEKSNGTVLRADATAVTGCSRYGKGAFVIGVFDQRIALTMPIESGSGGVGAFRSIATESGAQPLSSTYSEQPWLGDAFSAFTGSPANLPVDTHEMVGMIAPRGLFIMDNPHIAWLGAKSGSVAALGGAEVYKALGAGDNITYWSDVQDGTHCASRSEWKTPLQQNIQKYLLKTGNAAGTFRISSSATGNLAEWRDWQTPTLTADSSPSTSPSSSQPGSPSTSPSQSGSPSSSPSSSNPPSSSPPSSSPPSSSPPGTAACRVTYTASTWNTGFTADVAIANTGSSAINGWTLTWTWPGNQQVTSAWNATVTQSGTQVTARNASYNAAIAAGASTSFGFQASYSGTNTAPPRSPSTAAPVPPPDPTAGACAPPNPPGRPPTVEGRPWLFGVTVGSRDAGMPRPAGSRSLHRPRSRQ
jgi:hypothetical protein